MLVRCRAITFFFVFHLKFYLSKMTKKRSFYLFFQTYYNNIIDGNYFHIIIIYLFSYECDKCYNNSFHCESFGKVRHVVDKDR